LSPIALLQDSAGMRRRKCPDGLWFYSAFEGPEISPHLLRAADLSDLTK
jgi:hypothetical protein